MSERVPIDPRPENQPENSVALRAVWVEIDGRACRRPKVLVIAKPHQNSPGCLFDAEHCRKVALDLLDMADQVEKAARPH